MKQVQNLAVVVTRADFDSIINTSSTKSSSSSSGGRVGGGGFEDMTGDTAAVFRDEELGGDGGRESATGESFQGNAGGGNVGIRSNRKVVLNALESLERDSKFLS